MIAISITFAFVLGFFARRLNLPPMVGFLVAGFLLKLIGIQATTELDTLANMGITLLLFTIGLKLEVKTLLKPVVWATASIHMALTVLGASLLFIGLSVLGVPEFVELDWQTCALIAFALSFSSTVFAVVILDERGEMSSLHGKIAIGILIIQDIIAVGFLAISTGKVPNLWAISLLALPFLKPMFSRILNKAGHGDLLIIYGFFLAFAVGYTGFELMGIKGDLGAFIIGLLLATTTKAEELAKTLFSIKDLFLIGFFLSIGLTAEPTLSAFAIACLLVPLVPLKSFLFTFLKTCFRLRSRTAALGSLTLSNYSEFGLIVGYVGVTSGWITGEWLAVLAIAVSISFIIAAPINKSSHTIYEHLAERLKKFEHDKRLPEEVPVDIGKAKILICGLGRIGMGAYKLFEQDYPEKVIAIDIDEKKVEQGRALGKNVLLGDAQDSEFWQRLGEGTASDRGALVVLLTLSNHAANLTTIKMLSPYKDYGLSLIAVANYQDEMEELKEAGADYVFDLYAEAGLGLANEVKKHCLPISSH